MDGPRRLRLAFIAPAPLGADRVISPWPAAHEAPAVQAALASGTGPVLAIVIMAIVFAGLGLGLLCRAIIRRGGPAAVDDRSTPGPSGSSTSEDHPGQGRHPHRPPDAGPGVFAEHPAEPPFEGEQAALRRIATLVASGAPPSEVFAAMAKEIALAAGTNGASLSRFEADRTVLVVGRYSRVGSGLPLGRVSTEGQNLATEILRTGRPSRIDSYDDAPGDLAAALRRYGIRTAVAVPVVVNGRIWGLAAASNREDPLPDGIEWRLSRFTDLLGTAIANAQARDDLIASRARVVAATDQTRQRIERDLHDGTQQRLISLALDLRAVEAVIPAELPELRSRVAAIASGLAAALEELREISRGIHPAVLTEGGLRPALRALARRCPVAVDLDVRIGGRLPQATEVAAYYFVAEALANVAKHARATSVRVRAKVRDDGLALCVSDDGLGGADPSAGSGLVGLTDRIEALGGTIAINSPPGGGTRLDALLPVGPAPAAHAG
ncbi:GAF domain-containing sensor histidine kinase [Actinomadura sp. WMMA1423]|uniref:GAF domain-containing sensor histidine kinase n=1 Tax=Actinomadura sp. WMMA1423 TaxID=2591108 RepID=UPI00143CE558|nr:GAF domain-containing sensor histidine kinase [Actinomadura sp. WMMA1423]